MNEFTTWQMLGTYGGALAMVAILTQFTKELPVIIKIPTQIWSYILSFIVLITALVFTDGLTLNSFFLTIFNAAIVSLSANGSHSGMKRVSGFDTDGTLQITTTDEKDLYNFNVEDLDALAKKKHVTLKVEQTTS